MTILIATPYDDSRSDYGMLSDRILMELMRENDPLENIMRLYDEAINKRKFAMVLATTLLLRHRQWQVAQTATKNQESVTAPMLKCQE